MEKKIFETVEEVAEYLQNKCSAYSQKFVTELKKIEVDGMEKLLPQIQNYNIYSGFDKVVAIFATEDRIEYIWQTYNNNKYKYEARVVNNEEIANAIAQYPHYIKEGGCFDVSTWLFKEYCDSPLSIDYEVMTTIASIWN